MSLFQAGDENAYGVLVNRYKDKLINFIYHYLKDSESAEDVVQETMIKLYQKKHYYKEIAKFSTWLYTIAKNLANTELRKRKNRKTTLLSQFSND
ncbi:sigma-70 family RNA polymerase sigma factor, partial [Candidatus Marinimicrobia bacterium]|nr:sigma-70 family RNA polymerase sigma factor [Candidatus Neomarinimicrobiota bacterium]